MPRGRGAVAGVLACALREPDKVYKSRRTMILDVVAPFGDIEVLTGLLNAASDALAQHSVDAVVCTHLNPGLSAALKAAGYRFREPGRHLLVLPGGLSEDARAMLSNPDHWLVTQGDSDIDRP